MPVKALVLSLLVIGCGKAHDDSTPASTAPEVQLVGVDVALHFTAIEDGDAGVISACATTINELKQLTVPMTTNGDARIYFFDGADKQLELKTYSYSANSLRIKGMPCDGFVAQIWGRSLGKTDGSVRIQVFQGEGRKSAFLVFKP